MLGAGTYVFRNVSLIKYENLTEVYAQIQPNMVVPVQVHDGRLYVESMDIIDYLDEGKALQVAVRHALLASDRREFLTGDRFSTADIVWAIQVLQLTGQPTLDR